ncbi:MAG: tetratricopeptide repeat protein [Porphyromonas sp.]|nr:tetratricopeptide repeat protein [Porphyromonas sp.]
MSENKKHNNTTATEKLEEETVEALSKSEQFLNKNTKSIAIGILVVILLVGGYLAYRHLYAMPREEKAYEAMSQAEFYFDRDSFQLALEGNGADVAGFLTIIDSYKGTKAENLAQAYAGRSYYHLNDYERAIEHLKKYTGKDIMVAPSTKSLIGDSYVALGNYKEAVKYFEEAAKMSDNQLLTPIFLKKAGLAYEALGDKEKALETYQSIQDKYSDTPEGMEVQKLIQALSYN